MEITTLKDKDLGALDGLFRQFWGEPSDIEKMTQTFRRLSKDSSYVLLAAKQNGVLVGFCMGVVCRSLYGDCRPFMVIEDFIVDRQFRRKGIGTGLMASAEAYAIGSGCSQVILVTEHSRTDAKGFYESRGYAPDHHKGYKKQLKIR